MLFQIHNSTGLFSSIPHPCKHEICISYFYRFAAGTDLLHATGECRSWRRNSYRIAHTHHGVLHFDRIAFVYRFTGHSFGGPWNYNFRTDQFCVQTALELGCADITSNDAVSTCFKALGKSTVATVLQYHVVPILLSSEDVLATTTFTSLLGQTFTRRGTRFMDAGDEFTNPMLLTAQLDQRYQYGYVHAINRVLIPTLPSGQPTLVQLLSDAGAFNILLFLMDYAGVRDEFLALNDITFFVPTDRAFTKTAQDIGCSDTSTMSAVRTCYTSGFTPEQVAFGLRYQITSGVLTTSDVLARDTFLMLNDVFLYRRDTSFIDQVPFVTNAVLARKFQNLAFDKGIAHAITRAFIPFRDQIQSSNICKTFEFPISLADTSFLPLFKIVIGAKRCSAVRNAIIACDLLQRNICKNYRGEKFVGFGLSVGRIIAAAKQCTDVVTALRACPQAQ